MLKDIFTPSDCARCKLCCNFHRDSAWESPFLPEELARRMRQEEIEVEKRKEGGWSFVYHFRGSEAINCPKLDTNRGCTLSPEDKPFECRIWPLRIMKKDGLLTIGKYRSCPAIEGEKGLKLNRLVQDQLIDCLLNFVRQNPEAVRPFSSEYIILWQEEKR